MSDRVHALAFNALTKAVGEADVFVRLSDREAITAAVVTAVRSELADQIEAGEVYSSSDYETGHNSGLTQAAQIVRGDG
jgi:hypothetical protein